jgi:hypothetical protein
MSKTLRPEFILDEANDTVVNEIKTKRFIASAIANVIDAALWHIYNRSVQEYYLSPKGSSVDELLSLLEQE